MSDKSLGEKWFPVLLAEHGLPPAVSEFRFHPTRRWRADFAFPAHKVLVEIEGLGGGRHQRTAGFLADLEKYEAALTLGWTVYRLPGKWVYPGKRLRWRLETVTALRSVLGMSSRAGLVEGW